MGKVTGIAHVGIYTPNVEESIRFYVEDLGFVFKYDKKIVTPEGTIQLVLLENGSCVIELIQPVPATDGAGKPEGVISHLTLAVEGIEDLVSRLQQKGIIFETDEIRNVPGHYKGAKIIFFKGPSGERIELFEYL